MVSTPRRRARLTLTAVVAAVLLVSALVVRDAVTPAPGPPVETTAAPGTSAIERPPAAEQRVQEALGVATAADPGGALAVAVLDVSDGVAAGGPRTGEPFPAASMVKLLVAVDILDQRRAGVAVDAEDVGRLRAALGPSDDEAMNQLWTDFDGPGAVARVTDRLGLTATVAPEEPSQWGETLVSATDMAILYRHVLTGLPEPDRTLLVDALSAATLRASDGFDQEFGLLAAGAVATKQGWSCCPDGMRQLHSAGVVPGAEGTEGTVVVLLSTLPAGDDGLRALVDGAAAAAVRSLTGA